jgi:outer membrane protein TolC
VLRIQKKLLIPMFFLLLPPIAVQLASAQSSPSSPGVMGRSRGDSSSSSMPSLQEELNQDPFSGSVSREKVVPGSISLSLLDAINRGLKYNLGLYTSTTTQESVRGARLKALADLLPNVNLVASDTIQQVNLATFGISVPGFPSIVGPFNVVDFRANASVPVFDWQAVNKLRSADQNVAVANLGYRNARELVVLAVGFSYIQALAAEARVGAVEAQLRTAETLYQQAVDQRQAGVVPAIDVLRAQVEMQADRQRLVAARNTFDKQKLQLARTIGLPVGQQYTLAQKIPLTPPPPLPLEEAIHRALRDRPDFAQAQVRVRAAEYSVRAAEGERLPRVDINGDYGLIGRTIGTSHGTFVAEGGVTIPVFQGGRIRGEITQSKANLDQREAEVEDLRGRIEYDVRAAFLDLTSSFEQVHVAQSTLDLANQTLVQAQDRFRAGVTNNLEVVQAQESVVTATEALIESTLEFNLSKLALARSLGSAERATKEFLGGTP